MSIPIASQNNTLLLIKRWTFLLFYDILFSGYLERRDDMPHIHMHYSNMLSEDIHESMLDINSCGYFYTSTDPVYVERPFGRKDYLLLVITSGTFYFKIDGKTSTLHQGDFIFFPPDTPQMFHSSAGHKLEYIWLHFSGTLSGNLIKENNFSPMYIYHSDSPLSILQSLKSMADELNHKLKQYKTKSISLFLEILVMLSRSMENDSELHRDYQQILPALTAMETNATYTTTVSDYASLCSLKPDHFSHKFKKLIGVSPIQYLSDHLMQKAAELLTTTASGVSQISEELGFDDVKYFSRKFKKQYGVSPASYRKINRNDNN